MISIKEGWDADKRQRFEDVELHSSEDLGFSNRPYYKQRKAGIWIALILLAMVVAAVGAGGHWILSNQSAQLAWLPGISKSVSSLRERTTALEADLKEWSAKQEVLAARMQKLDGEWESRLKGVRQYAAELVAHAIQKEHADLNQRAAALNAQVDEMKSRQQADQAHLEQLEHDLASTRQDLASVKDGSSNQLAALQEQQASAHDQIASLNGLLSTDQVGFEAQKGRDEQIIPGISLHLTRMDISHQRFQGWIWLKGSGRRIWFRRQAIESPVVFYPDPGGEACELVVTRVNRKDAAGYLLIPSDSQQHFGHIASNIKSTTRAGKNDY
ncbi:MAG: hypothetical protein EPN47_00915 [Acidobacteria bacterium]|nr:MAG: hypothetical protein EPN47_00915 [Acidobacteriota bacterium]